MRELILNFHGLGQPGCLVDAQEARCWWDASAFCRLLDQICDRPRNADPQIGITFDDGNASDSLVALPELVKRGLTATFFVCAGRIGAAHYLDGFMIRDLLAARMRIGSHGMNHRNWRDLDQSDLDIEIREARKKLEDVAQRSVTTVAIPFGAYDRRVLRQVRREGWACIYTSDGGTPYIGAKIKGRTTLRIDMQERNTLRDLLAHEAVNVRMRRTVVSLYKRLR